MAQLDELMSTGMLNHDNGRLASRYRFVPIDELLIASSHAREYDTERFVYLGSDTVTFRDLISKVHPPAIDDALEIGCGTGFLSLWASRRARRVTALDINPHALAVTRINAEINHVGNIVASESDVYSAVEGQFDSIISNPPYMFLPDENAGRSHAYGGHLGMDITRRILLGLDAHLKDRGTAYLFAESYIQDDGTNNLRDMIIETLKMGPWKITMNQVDYQPILSHRDFYTKYRLTHSIRYFITIQKASEFGFAHRELRGASKRVEQLKIQYRSRWQARSNFRN